MAETRINAASLFELWWKLDFYSVGMFLPRAVALTDEISQTIFIKAPKFNMLSKEGRTRPLSELFHHLGKPMSDIKVVKRKQPYKICVQRVRRSTVLRSYCVINNDMRSLHHWNALPADSYTSSCMISDCWIWGWTSISRLDKSI